MSVIEPAPSGQQWRIASHGYEATIVEVGGGIRTLTHDGEPVLFGYDEDVMADAARGHVLAPWPNRIAHGQYSFGGHDFVLPLTEPARGNASHGLVHWMPWQLVERGDDALTVGVTLHPQPGWAWTLRLEITYRLDADGLTVLPRARNLSTSACPFGFGAHPYLTAGESNLDHVTLTAPVATQIVVDDALIPTTTTPADHDFTAPTPLAGIGLDTCFTDITADDDGRWRVTVSTQERRTTLWADADAFAYVQLFTGDGLPAARRRCSGLAVEPMTCPANAFNSGSGVLTLAPGEEWTAEFGVVTSRQA